MNTIHYKFSEDTLIDGIDYMKIMLSRDSTAAHWILDGAFIRQEQQKIYFKDNSAEERLIYDFGLQIGDTIAQLNQPWEENKWVVSEIRAETINGKLHKSFLLDHVNYGSEVQDYWIEGLGSTYGIITPGYHVIDFSSGLLCVKRNAEYLYVNPDFNSCYINVGVDDINPISGIKIYPNPANTSCTIYIENDPDDLKLKIINGLGKEVQKHTKISGDYEIDLKGLNPGLYYFIFSNNKGVYHTEKIMIGK